MKIKTADLPREMNRELFFALGGLCSGLAGCFGLWIALDNQLSAYNLMQGSLGLMFFGVGSLHHFLKNDEAKCGRELTRWGKTWPYPILCLVGWFSFNSLKSQLLYAAMPVWFHLYDRLGIFIKPPTVYVPFNRLYNAFPTRMRQTIHEKWHNSNTFYAAIIKYLLGA